ncbi:protein-disulfide isomerase [Microbacterium resistens]|uniref:Protein-disulfide isomerase n=1 Tax=Microbacterium resistens TaxID=156977 RepID=A0ABU1SAT8_9MICO|nr:thioredoxin domain-containing protein [Microbacterium resistens]MDR6866732.1 protein-disulfide isomerase [Microbacterium resistens]
MAAAKGRTNGFAIGISIAVVVVLVALGGVVIWLNNKATDAGPAPKSEILNTDTGALTYGGGKDVVAVYLDFQCPICNTFEQQYGEKLEKAAEDGKITLEYHPIAILDRYSQGTLYSSRSAAAAFCVAESNPDKYLDYAKTLFANQPKENSPGLDNDQLIEFAKEVGADKAASCITDEKYVKYPAAQALKHEIKGTPSIDINGKRLDLQKNGVAQLEELIN